MFHFKSHPNSRFAMQRAPTPRLRLVLSEVALTLGVLVAVAFLVTRANPDILKNVTNFFIRSNPAEAPAAVSKNVPNLIADLKSSDPGTRLSAAQALGAMRAGEATDELIAATYDADAHVREQAATSLGEIGAIQAIPRLRELQMIQGNTFIQVAASQAQENITKNVAARLTVARIEVQALAVARGGAAYAVVSNKLYSLNDDQWFYISQMPDSLNDIAVAPDGKTLYDATQVAGLYRSGNGGQNWEYLQFGLHTPTQLTVTAVTVDPENADALYIALAASDSDNHLNSLGISKSTDGGKTWTALPDSPIWSVTRHLVINPTTPGYLYGMTDEGPWRYNLTSG